LFLSVLIYLLALSTKAVFQFEDCNRIKARIRLKIEIEIGLKFNQSKERKPITSLVNFALIGQNLIQSQSQYLV